MSISSRCLGSLATLLALWIALPVTTADAQLLTIEDAAIECIENLPYPLFSASISPDPQKARLYFRASQGSDFYYVEMTGGSGSYQAILPVPSAETAEVVYYVEALTPDADSARTEEYATEVRDEGKCDRRRYLGAEPGISVYATAEGASALPAGFQSVGITSTVSASGVVAGVQGAAAAGGGLGPLAIGGIAVGGLAGGVLVVDALDDDEEETASEPTPP